VVTFSSPRPLHHRLYVLTHSARVNKYIHILPTCNTQVAGVYRRVTPAILRFVRPGERPRCRADDDGPRGAWVSIFRVNQVKTYVYIYILYVRVCVCMLLVASHPYSPAK